MNLLESKPIPAKGRTNYNQLLSSLIAPETNKYGNNLSTIDIYYLGLRLKRQYNKRLPASYEELLLKKPHLALDYCWKVLKRPWPALESILIQESTESQISRLLLLKYASRISKKRYIEIEPLFIHDLNDHIKSRVFPRDDPDNTQFYVMYAKNCIKGRWSDFEKELILHIWPDIRPEFSAKTVHYYIQNILKNRWIEYEQFLIELLEILNIQNKDYEYDTESANYNLERGYKLIRQYTKILDKMRIPYLDNFDKYPLDALIIKLLF